MSHEHHASDFLNGTLATLDRLMEIAPDAPEAEIEAANVPPSQRKTAFGSNFPKAYRSAWERPQDEIWQRRFARIKSRIASNGMTAIFGSRGTGKTRIAIEAAKDANPDHMTYMTPMEFFIRLKSTFGNLAKERQIDVVDEIAKAKFLIMDEFQERGETVWEDRMLTHIIDRRYLAELPTVIISNLTKDAMIEAMGESITDRLRERGGMIEMTGESFRAKQPTP